jgi:AbrB family looped-hinge helix DNA binding protein
MAFMATRISIDKRGRVVLPKSIREQLRVQGGDDFLAEVGNDRVILCPIRKEALLKKEFGIWVYQGGPSGLSSVELIDAERAKRLRDQLGQGSSF